MTQAVIGLRDVIFSDAGSRDWFDPLPGERIAMRIEGGQTGNSFSLTEIIVAPQAGPPLHIHHDADEVLYVLEGEVDFVCEARRFRTGPGGFAAIPRGKRHAFRNFQATPARMIVLLSPGGFEQFMHAINGRPPAEVAQIGGAFHFEIVGDRIGEAD
jgi:mannose-6-phosphate isomerase-like protein (cupin superfamily)